ncbi:MAG: hypothetical protein NVS4B3_11890 [Gemmatimonadaceae bacterium]
MPHDQRAIAGVDDSKRLTGPERDRLARVIRTRALALGIGAASAREIDRVNIYQATILAMQRALRRLSLKPDHVVVDGRPLAALGVSHTAVVHGDARCYQVACASIIAKVTRDRLMRALARRHPGYLWERNVGYGTADHEEGIRLHGLSRHHRLTFASLWTASPMTPPGEVDMLHAPSVVAESATVSHRRCVPEALATALHGHALPPVRTPNA